MTWRYRKSIKVIPGLYLNFSKRGISTTIGPRGFSVNSGAKGSFLNLGIPGSGISIRQSLFLKNDQNRKSAEAEEIADKLKFLLQKTYDGSEEIKSESIDQLTSPGLQGLKEAIIVAHTQHTEISEAIKTLSNRNELLDRKLGKMKRSLFRFLYKRRIERHTAESLLVQDELNELNEQLQFSTVGLHINNDDDFRSLYEKVKKAYHLFVSCNKIWDITTSKQIDRIQRRSAAGVEVSRAEIKTSIESSDLIVTSELPLRIQNKNGGDLFLYPGFVIIHEQALDFAILDYSEFDLKFSETSFIETESIPGDAEVIGKTWAKVNKDGSPDRRFSNNYQIPITKYAELTFTSPTGLNEKYLISNRSHAYLFYTALKDYIDAIRIASKLLNELKNV